MKGLEYIEKFLNTQNTIPNASGVIFKKQTYFDVEGLTRAYAWRLGNLGKDRNTRRYFFTHECLNYFRYHNTSVIAQAKKKKIILKLDVKSFCSAKACHSFKKPIPINVQKRIRLIKLTKDVYQKN